jgi:hypothetical protein
MHTNMHIGPHAKVCYFHPILAKTEIQWQQTDTVELTGTRLQILIVNVLKLMYLKRIISTFWKIGMVVDLILHK